MTGHILILVENLSVPFDRRVWQESRALADAGHRVTVICPQGASLDQEPEVTIDRVRILRYPLRPARGGPVGYMREYSVALWHSMRLALKVHRTDAIDVVHFCNPPDLLFIVALVLRVLGGTRSVFDQHDLVPELFLSRFPSGGKILFWLTRIAERVTYWCSDAVISTNESYRRVAIERGGMTPERVAVVRSAPDLTMFQRCEPDPALRNGKRYLGAYLGVMGPQDGIDYALRAIAHLRNQIGRRDTHFVFMGGGDAFDAMVALADELGIADIVEFTGWVAGDFPRRCLSTADVCLSPDPKNPLNDVSTMNKVVEYMAMAKPLVSFDLLETHVSAGRAAVYVPDNNEEAFASAIDQLLDDPVRRSEMGRYGRERVARELSWDVSRKSLLDFYARLFFPESQKPSSDAAGTRVSTLPTRSVVTK